MKALSLFQPFASAIAWEAKRHETRSWPAPKWIIGERIAICATKNWEPGSGGWDGVEAYLLGSESREWARRAGLIAPITVVHPTKGEYVEWRVCRGTVLVTRGKVLCTAVVSDCQPTKYVRSRVDDLDYILGDYGIGRFAWELSDVRRVERPVPITGRQRLFNVPPDVEAEIRRLGG